MARSVASTCRCRPGWRAACVILRGTSCRPTASGARGCFGPRRWSGWWPTISADGSITAEQSGRYSCFGLARRGPSRRPSRAPAGGRRLALTRTHSDGRAEIPVMALEAKEFKVAPPPEEFRDLGLRADSTWSRLWQLAVAVIGLLLLLPVSMAIAIATKLTSRGPVLYKGTRIGRNMEPFTIFK